MRKNLPLNLETSSGFFKFAPPLLLRRHTKMLTIPATQQEVEMEIFNSLFTTSLNVDATCEIAHAKEEFIK